MIRSIRLLFAIILFTAAGFFAYFMYSLTQDLIALSTHGEVTTGTVVDYKVKEKRKNHTNEKIIHRNQVAYLDQEQWFRVNRKYAIGTEVAMLYLPEHPEVSRITQQKSFKALLEEEFGLVGVLFAPIFFLGLLYAGGLQFRKFLLKIEDEEDDEMEPE